jgi:hypothetical protein
MKTIVNNGIVRVKFREDYTHYDKVVTFFEDVLHKPIIRTTQSNLEVLFKLKDYDKFMQFTKQL